MNLRPDANLDVWVASELDKLQKSNLVESLEPSFCPVRREPLCVEFLRLRILAQEQRNDFRKFPSFCFGFRKDKVCEVARVRSHRKIRANRDRLKRFPKTICSCARFKRVDRELFKTKGVRDVFNLFPHGRPVAERLLKPTANLRKIGKLKRTLFVQIHAHGFLKLSAQNSHSHHMVCEARRAETLRAVVIEHPPHVHDADRVVYALRVWFLFGSDEKRKAVALESADGHGAFAFDNVFQHHVGELERSHSRKSASADAERLSRERNRIFDSCVRDLLYVDSERRGDSRTRIKRRDPNLDEINVDGPLTVASRRRERIHVCFFHRDDLVV